VQQAVDSMIQLGLCCFRQFYRPEDYESLQVSAEVKELFEHVKKYVFTFQ